MRKYSPLKIMSLKGQMHNYRIKYTGDGFSLTLVRSWTYDTMTISWGGVERSRNLDRSFRNIYIIPSFPTREQHAHSVQNARLRFNKLNQSYSCYPREKR